LCGAELDLRFRSFVCMDRRHLRSVWIALALVAPGVDAWAAACHDEADRLADRHQLEAQAQSESASSTEGKATREQARELLSAARKADDEGIVEQCLRQLAQARSLIENDGSSAASGIQGR
jgi:hypothetical protein